MLFLLTLVIIAAFERVRHLRKQALVSEYQFRLFALRDELRERALRDDVEIRSWLFHYFDSTTTKAIEILEGVSLWQLFVLTVAHRRDQAYQILSARLDAEMAKPKHSGFAQYEKEFMEVISEFLLRRHFVLIPSVMSVDKVSTVAVRFVEETKRLTLDVLLKSPETSTLPQCAPA